jgi:hypothetical protein
VSRWSHEPQTGSEEVEQRIRQAARHRCGCCLSPQWLLPWELELEHIITFSAQRLGRRGKPLAFLSLLQQFQRPADTRARSAQQAPRQAFQPAPAAMVAALSMERGRRADYRFDEVRAGDGHRAEAEQFFRCDRA